MIDITSAIDNFNLVPQISTEIAPAPPKSSKWLIIVIILILLGIGLVWYFNIRNEPERD
ncbi:MAG: hypothetical protein IPI31_09145 [Bacteroidetes bacterium]|jgi:nitric oxide reductase large subunit|nr:hypothetical protein [Bacteroidota bacterium]